MHRNENARWDVPGPLRITPLNVSVPGGRAGPIIGALVSGGGGSAVTAIFEEGCRSFSTVRMSVELAMYSATDWTTATYIAASPLFVVRRVTTVRLVLSGLRPH